MKLATVQIGRSLAQGYLISTDGIIATVQIFGLLVRGRLIHRTHGMAD